MLSQYASTHQIWNSYLKEYRRYAPDSKRDGRTDGRTDRGMDKANTICIPQFLWGHNNSFVKKAELMIAANPVCIYSTSLYKESVFCNFDIKMNVEMFPKI